MEGESEDTEGSGMADHGAGPPPPYFDIDPDSALAALGPQSGSDDFARIAQACERGRDDLAGRGLGEDGARRLRLFSTWEITRYLIPVAPAHFRRVLRQNPDLPQGASETEGGAKWFTFDEVLHYLDEKGTAKQYWPEILQVIDEMPRTPSGKIQKFKLREMAQALDRG